MKLEAAGVTRWMACEQWSQSTHVSLTWGTCSTCRSTRLHMPQLKKRCYSTDQSNKSFHITLPHTSLICILCSHLCVFPVSPQETLLPPRFRALSHSLICMACQKGAGRTVPLAAKQLLLARLVLTCCAVLRSRQKMRQPTAMCLHQPTANKQELSCSYMFDVCAGHTVDVHSTCAECAI
jgi:hypothetical protein